jgi:serine/threonine protein kinase
LALKVIHNLDRKKGGKELRALRLLKNIRHPNLVPLTGFWLKTADGQLLDDEAHAEVPSGYRGDSPRDDRLSATMTATDGLAATAEATAVEAEELVIAMGLAQKSLFDRLMECRAAGQPGIEFEELLTYMDDSSRAIDLLNATHGIQHCDVKPQNILLQSGAAQVGDFGLATSIGDMRQSSMAAGTIAYGAPEVLLGRGPGPWTDQYSLAITYFELRTGTLPFKSERISDVFEAKQHGAIELSRLAPGEREVIAKAASVRPEDRYANTAQMVRALRHCGPPALEAGRSPAAESTDAFIPGPLRDTAAPGPSRSRPVSDATASRKSFVCFLAGLAILALILVGLMVVSRSNGYRGARNAVQAAPAAGGTLDAGTTACLPGQSIEISKEIAQATRESAQNTKTVAEATRQSAENTKEIAAATRQISLSLEAIREGFAAAAQRGGIIDNPRMPSDFYHNARLYEQRGDYPNARRNYLGFFSFDLDLVDPHRRYQRLLVMQEGRAAARQAYAEMEATAQSFVVSFAAILLEDDDRRAGLLTEFTELHPGFAPAVWELSREYSRTRLGAQGLADMAREKELLEKFRTLAEEGRLLRYFLDQTMAGEMLDDATARLAALGQFDPAVFENPITVTATTSNTAWTVNLTVAEVAREILVRTADGRDFESTGHTTYVDQRTGRPNAKPYFQLPLQTPATTFSVKYQDIRGQWQGPFDLAFDPHSERIRFGKSVLDGFPNLWIVYGDLNGQPIAYFTHLIGHRETLREIRYGIDTEEVDRPFPLAEPDPEKPSSIRPGEKIYVTIPASTKFLAVQLTYRDGTLSKVVRFDRSAGPQ